MQRLFIVSPWEGAGKTTLCAGLGAHFMAKGLSLGYLCVSAGAAAAGDGDASFLKGLLRCEGPPEALSLSLPSEATTLAEGAPALEEALIRIGTGRDLVLVESRGALPSAGLLETLEAKALLVVRYVARLNRNKLLEAVASLGEGLVGVVLNAVPERALRGGAKSLIQALEAKGVPLLGVIPWDRTLMAPSISDLARWLEGEVLNAQGKGEELVEHLLAGSPSADPANPYFAGKSHLGMICRSDLVDVQLAALEAAIKCLVLTGGGEPHFSVRYRAEDLEISLLLVQRDTVHAIAQLDESLARARFRHRAKLHRVQQLLTEHVKLGAVEAALGLVDHP